MTSEQPITGKTDYSQGPEGGQMDFLLSVANGSVGAEVAMHAVKPLPDGTRIEIPKSPVTAPFIFYGRTYHVPADFQTEIIYTYYPNGTPVSPHLKLSVRVQFVPSRGNARIAHSSALDEKPPLVLNTSLQNPMLSNSAQVAVSTDSSYPVLNTLNLIIHNPANNPTIPFENPDGLTTDDDLPPITGAPPGPRLDRLYIYFPYGDTGGNLTTEDLAAAMTLSVASDNTSWDVSRMSAPDIGPYWILFPKSEYFMAPRESAGFVLTGLKTFNPADSLTHLELKKQVTGYAVETDSNSNISLVDAQPKILTFDTSQNDVPAGTSVDLSWTTWNAKTCSLGESEGLPANEQAHPVRPLTSGVYKLQAFSPSDKSVREFEEITVQPVKIDSFTADPPEGSRIGEEVTLKWQTSSAVTVDIAPDVGQVCEDAAGCNTGERAVHPTQRTQYVLSATGEGGLKTRDVVVFPLPRSWGKATSSAPWNTRDRPVLLTFNNELWFMAGGTSGVSNDIYNSFDGATWRLVNSNAPWTMRSFAGGLVFGTEDPQMWLLGGVDKQGTALNDIWASNDPKGTSWREVSDGAEWSARSHFSTIVYQDKMWLLGGRGAGGSGLNDVWSSSDGETWTAVTAQAAWSPRSSFGVAEFFGRLWIFGGQTGANPSDVSNEVWSSEDGAAWMREPKPPWGKRSFANAQSFGEDLFLFGGAFGEANAYDDLYRMNIEIKDDREIIKWVQLPSTSQNNSAALGSTKLAGAAWLAGGWSAPNGVRGPNHTVWLYAPASSTPELAVHETERKTT